MTKRAEFRLKRACTFLPVSLKIPVGEFFGFITYTD